MPVQIRIQQEEIIIQKLKEILQSLSLGIYDNKEMIISKDEIGEMNLAAKKLIFLYFLVVAQSHLNLMEQMNLLFTEYVVEMLTQE